MIQSYKSEMADEQMRLIELYKNVFAGYPWYEEWIDIEVKNVIDRAIWWMKYINLQPIGFCAAIVHESIMMEVLDVQRNVLPEGKLGYQAELGILSEHRQKKVATELFLLRQEWFKKQGVQIVLVRTKPDAITYSWFKKLGYEICYNYTNDQRVLLYKQI